LDPIEVSFPGGAQVAASIGGFRVLTDQPGATGIPGAAPTPFQLFLASLATCAGIYVLNFLNARQLPTTGLRIVQEMVTDEKGTVTDVRLVIHLPEGFPPHYVDAVVRVADQCKVKKHLEHSPHFVTEAVLDESRR
jgi:putative redox protein